MPFPLLVISEILGVPETEWRQCYEWSEAVIPGATDWPQERRDALMGDMVGTSWRRRNSDASSPRDDVLSELATVTVDGDNLSDDELAMFLVQLLVAGNETTRNMLSAGLVALADAPGQWRRLVEDPGLVRTRRGGDAPVHDPGHLVHANCNARHRCSAARRWRRASRCCCCSPLPTATRHVFGPDAGELDVGRDPNPHVAFGFGNHFCLGATLARLEGRVVLEELLGRFSSVERAGDVELSPSSVIAGVRRAELCFGLTSRPAADVAGLTIAALLSGGRRLSISANRLGRLASRGNVLGGDVGGLVILHDLARDGDLVHLVGTVVDAGGASRAVHVLQGKVRREAE